MDANAVQLRYFTQPSILQQLGHNRLARFFQDFEQELRDAGSPLPFPSPDDPTSLDRLAAAFGRTESLPERMRNVLPLIEAAASPENIALLEAVIQRRIPCISLNRACPLDCALELWFACPEELPQFAKGREKEKDGTVEGTTTELAIREKEVRPHPGTPARPNNAVGEDVRPHPSPMSSQLRHDIDAPSQGTASRNVVPQERETAPRDSSLQFQRLNSMGVEEDPPFQSSNSALLDSLASTMRRFVVLPKHAAETLALWVVHTYAFHLGEVSIYVGVESPEKRCGKTTLLGVLGKLVSRPVVASNISPSAFFRVIEEMQPTLLIDEADTFLQGNDPLRGILNAGYQKPNAYVIRVRGEGSRVEGRGERGPGGERDEGRGEGAASERDSVGAARSLGQTLISYSCWCPKAIAAIGHLPDTLADRCIVIRMERKRGDEECERLRSLDPADLREQCTEFVLEHESAIATARPEIPDALHDRAADIWEPLLAIADLAGGAWPGKARAAAIALSARADDSSPISSLLSDILLAFLGRDNGKGRIFSRRLVAYLNARSANRSWAKGRNGKPITELWLSQQLRPYGIRPRNVCIGDQQAKGYLKEDFKEVFRRYTSKAEFDALYPESGEADGGAS